MYLLVEDNPNCPSEERVFSEQSSIRGVARLHLEVNGRVGQWYDVTGVEEGGQFVPAKAVQVEDSGAGIAWLIFGGAWGLRLRLCGSSQPWALENPEQFGTPFKVLDSSGTEIDFQS